jgi:hypothetical protein
VELDEGPVLVEDDEVDAVEQRRDSGWGHTPAATTSTSGAGPAPMTRQASGAGQVIGVLSGVAGQADLEPIADAVIPSVGELVDGDG